MSKQRFAGILAAFVTAALAAAPAGAAGMLRLVATVPDLGSLAETVGGDDVSVTTLVKGPQDPHFIEARPSFIKAMHEADALVLVGLDLEIGWVPALLSSARNVAIRAGAPGHIDASRAIAPLGVPQGPVTRAMGDVHPYGNPHYLSDPINGLRVAALLRDRFSELRPDAAAAFAERYRRFAAEVATRLVGAEAVAGKDPEEIVRAIEEGRADEVLGAAPGGWLGTLRGARGRPAVEDHRLWEYFARRFGVRPVATLEPFPGIAPTTRHLAEVVAEMERDHVDLILSSAYFDPRHANWVAERTGAKIVPLAHQAGSREGTGDYLAAIDYNVRSLANALGRAGG
jgi:zinc/manganese transport system substrate-binding protein